MFSEQLKLCFEIVCIPLFIFIGHYYPIDRVTSQYDFQWLSTH